MAYLWKYYDFVDTVNANLPIVHLPINCCASLGRPDESYNALGMLSLAPLQAHSCSLRIEGPQDEVHIFRAAHDLAVVHVPRVQYGNVFLSNLREASLRPSTEQGHSRRS